MGIGWPLGGAVWAGWADWAAGMGSMNLMRLLRRGGRRGSFEWGWGCSPEAEFDGWGIV